MQRGIRDTSAQDVAIERSKRGWLTWAVPGAGALMLAFFGISTLATWLSAEASVPSDRIRTAVVERGDLVRDLSVQGRVVAAVSPTLYSPATGTVTLDVLPGDTVTEGQQLATLDSPAVRAQFLQEQSTLDRLHAELDRERIQAQNINPMVVVSTIKGILPEAISIFLSAPSMQDLTVMLRKRNTESKTDLDLRLQTAIKEMESLNNFDYVVINQQHKIDNVVADIKAIITAEKLRLVSREYNL